MLPPSQIAERLLLAVIDERYEARHAPGEGISWSRVFQDWVGRRSMRARNLAIIQLYETCGWDFPAIGLAFGMKKAAISLAISRTRARLTAHATGETYSLTDAAILDEETAAVDRQLRFQWPAEAEEDQRQWPDDFDEFPLAH
ncbi:MAG: hypothetical protein ACKVT0_23155 [Planctomycetaceae bacterium]